MAEASSAAAMHKLGKSGAASSDLDVLDDLLHDVDTEDGTSGGDEEAYAFYDAYGPGADGSGGDEGAVNASADDILSQLDSITTLEDDEIEGEDNGFKDVLSEMSLKSGENNCIETRTQSSLVDSTETAADQVVENKTDDMGLEAPREETVSVWSLGLPSDEDVVNAVLDFASGADEDSDEKQETAGMAPIGFGDVVRVPTADYSQGGETKVSLESGADALAPRSDAASTLIKGAEGDVSGEENLDDDESDVDGAFADMNETIPLDDLSQSGDGEMGELPAIEIESPKEGGETIESDDEILEAERHQFDSDAESRSAETGTGNRRTEEEAPKAEIEAKEVAEERENVPDVLSARAADIVRAERESLQNQISEDTAIPSFEEETGGTNNLGEVATDAAISETSYLTSIPVEVGKAISHETDDQVHTVDRTVNAQVVQNESTTGEPDHVEMPIEPPAAYDSDGGIAVSVATGPLPPPAPLPAPAVFGSMNPIDDSEESDDSMAEEEDELAGSVALPPPLHIGEQDEDSDDELEIDATVVNSLEMEQKLRTSLRDSMSKKGLESSKMSLSDGTDEDNSLLKALPGTKVGTSDAVELSFEEEVRVAHTVTPVPGDTFTQLDKAPRKDSSDLTFGISYQSTRKKRTDPLNGDGVAQEGGYSLPRGPSFPDEREFENEVELDSDLTFSVASAAHATDSTQNEKIDAANDDGDDEFDFDVESTTDSSSLSEDMLRARLESYEAHKREEEEALVRELKRATDEEKRLIESGKALEESDGSAEPEATTDHTGGASAADAISLTELHSMYKRGLGDQGVLMDDEELNETTAHNEAVTTGQGLSVMGRILSKSYGLTDAIVEEGESNEEVEAHGSEEDSNENQETENEDVVAVEDDLGDLDARRSGATFKENTSKKPTEASVDEWKEIELVQHVAKRSIDREGSASALRVTDREDQQVSWISYADAVEYFTQSDEILQHKDKIVAEDFPRGSCFSCFGLPRLTFPGAPEERDRVFCIAATPFDPHNKVITSMLQTIYCRLIKASRDVSLIGRHWEDIGFQGTDPSTDLRGCGVLSLLQMLYLVESHPEMARRFLQLSQHPTRHFPLACMLINVTLQCVGALRSGALYPECNHHSSVFTGMNRLFVALSSKLYTEIYSSSEEIPNIMKEVLDRGRTHPMKVVDEVFDGPTPRLSTLVTTAPAVGRKATEYKSSERKVSDDNLQFTEIALHSVDEN